jgi:hypothetical protein
MREPDDFGLEDPRERYPILWWQLWRFNHNWNCYTYRFRWLRDFCDNQGQSDGGVFKRSISRLKSLMHFR